MERSALHLGVSPLYARLPSYVLIMGGGAIVNMTYCFMRLAFKKDISLRADLAQPGHGDRKNASLAAAAASCGICSSSFMRGARPIFRCGSTM